MFRYLTGKLAKHSYESAIIDIFGIGFYVFIPPSLQEQLPPIGQNVTLHVSFVIREFSQNLYGFLQEHERDLFEELLNVSGIGPKLALNIVGHLPPSDFADALLRKDTQKLCQVPGIGKKTAERLLLELKGITLPLPQQASKEGPPLLQDAILALVNLGYSQLQAQRAVTKTLEGHPSSDLSSLITASLRNI
jgi:Holliday junction DNA helicase RuvA